MRHLIQLGSAEVPTKIMGRDIAKTEAIPVYGDDPRHYPPLAALALNPQLLDFLLDHLPHNDDFTSDLEDLRKEMFVRLWERVAS